LTLYSFRPSDPAKYGAFNFVVTNIQQLDDNAYHGVEFTAVKRLSHRWQVLGGFTIQRQKGVYSRGYSDQAYSDNFTDPNLDINRKNNYLNLDATYVFKVDSTYQLPGDSVPASTSSTTPAFPSSPQRHLRSWMANRLLSRSTSLSFSGRPESCVCPA